MLFRVAALVCFALAVLGSFAWLLDYRPQRVLGLIALGLLFNVAAELDHSRPL